MYSLKTLMEMNGHDHIDVLKIDIESAEFDVMSALVEWAAREHNGTLPFGQLQLEIHAWIPHDDFQFFLDWWETLERVGLRPFWFEPNLLYSHLFSPRPDAVEYSFINIRGEHDLIMD